MNSQPGPVDIIARSLPAVLAAGVILFTLFGYRIFLDSTFTPALRERDARVTEVMEAQQALSDAQAIRPVTLDDLKAQIAQVQAFLNGAFLAFLTDLQGGLALDALHDFAGASGVTVSGLQTEAVPGLGDRQIFTIVKARMTARGPSRNLVDFVARLRELSSKGFLIDALHLEPANGAGVLTLDFTLFTSMHATGEALRLGAPLP